ALNVLGCRRAARIFRRALRLSIAFRVTTTSINFKMLGFSQDLFSLLDFSFMSELRPGSHLRGALDDVCDLLEHGRRSGAVISRPSAPRRAGPPAAAAHPDTRVGATRRAVI